MASILIVEDHPVVFEGLQKLLTDKGIASQCFAAYTVNDCWIILKSFIPDIILLDYNLPDGNGIDLCEAIIKIHPEMKILAISSCKEQSLVVKMITIGAMGYVLKNATENEIIEAVTTILNGEKYLCEETKEILNKKNDTKAILTRRELEVLKLIADGWTNPEIAERLFISSLTVISHRKNLILKLSAKNSASLIKIAVLQGFINDFNVSDTS